MRLSPIPTQTAPATTAWHHIIDGALAMTANHTGLAITPEFLRDAEFTCGKSLRTLEGAGAAAGQPRNRPARPTQAGSNRSCASHTRSIACK